MSKRAVSKRKGLRVPVKISIEPDTTTGSLQMPLKDVFVRGETRDLSETGVGFIVDSIRLQENYLVGEGRILNAEVSLPNGIVKMQLMGQRYKQIGQHVSASKYLIGAKILKMSAGDQEIYKECLKNKRFEGGALELGIKES
ncbi:MAG: PilZ domain-containing protein [Pyrinomonadaceae bacterium]|nr:PilZ domain-containing protein [Pyrinomonadaceae bacterium]